MLNKTIHAFLLAFLFVFVSFTSYSTKYYVNNNSTVGDVFTSAVGNNANSGLSTSLPKLTLANAFAAAAAGDTIYVDKGSFNEVNLNLNKAMVIIGAGPGNTIFTGNATVNRFATIAANNVVIKNMTLRNYYESTDGQVITMTGRTGIVFDNIVVKDNQGNATSGANIALYAGSSVAMSNCLFSCSGWNSDGGGTVLINASTLSVNNCVFKDVRNFADYGGALEIRGASSSVTVTASTFDECSARRGGAIFQDAGTLVVTNSCFTNNFTAGDGSDPSNGGGAFASNSAAGTSCSFTNCVFTNNSVNRDLDQNASSDGGAIMFRSANGTFTFDLCQFNNNSVINANQGQDFFIDEGGSGLTGTINNCTFGASAQGSGSNRVNIYNADLETADVTLSNSGTPTFTGTAFSGVGTNALAPSATPTATCASTNLAACGAVVDCANETNPPVIVSCVSDKTINGVCSYTLLNYIPEVAAFDDCSFTITQSPIAGTIVSTGVTTVTMTVTDQKDNFTVCTFTVTVNGSSITAPVVGTITQPTCSVATGSVDLSGLPAGNWTLTPSSGASVNSSGASYTFTGLTAASTYTFTVTDNNGCTSPASANVVINAQPIVPTAPIVGTITQPTCSVATGSVDLSGLPAVGTWTVTEILGNTTITGTGTTATFSGLNPGNYSFTVTHASGCTSSVSASSATINPQPSTPSAPIIGTITQPTCSVATGSVDLSGLPAVGTWTVTETLGNTTITGTGTTATFSGLNPGTYNFTVTNASGCTSSVSASSATINAQPTVPTAPIVGTITQPTCSVATGSVDLSGLPAAGIWTVTETLGNTTITGTGTTATFSGLNPGTYSFTVTHASGCTSSVSASSATINPQPSTPSAPIVGTITQPTCSVATGSVDLSGLPAVGTWTVTETLGNTTITGTGTTTTFSSLNPGTYSFTVTNASGCTSSVSASSATINPQPSTPSAPVLGTITQPDCSTPTGSVDLSGLPAVGTWTVTETLGNTTITGTGTTATFSGLNPGTYSFTVTNASGCTSSVSASSATINAQPIVPSAPIVGTITQPTCLVATGSVDLSGLPAVGTWTVTETLGNTTITGTGTTTTFSALNPGTYSFSVTHASGCISSNSASSATINPQPSTPSAPVLGTITQPDCSTPTGSVDLSGLPAVGTWTVTETLGNTTITGTGTTATFSGLNSGTYSFTVTNASGCTSSVSASSATINSNPSTPSSPIVGTITQPTCSVPTGSVDLSGLPAVGTWTVTETLGNTTITGTGTTATFSGLAPGNYSFLVTNNLGCTSIGSNPVITINPQPSTPTAPVIGTITNTDCTTSTGSVDLSGLPAVGAWTVTETLGNTTITGTGTTATFSGLTPGTYSFTVTNASGCTSLVSASSAIIDPQPSTPTAPVIGTITNTDCTTPTGSVDLSGLPAVGTWIVTETLGNTTITGTGTTATFSGLTPGTYNFTVTNASGCTSLLSASSAIIDPQPSTPTAPVLGTITNTDCTTPTGSVDLSGLPAVGTWTVTETLGNTTLTGTGTTAIFSGLTPGTYSFTVTNASGCTSSVSASSAIIDPQPSTPTAPTGDTIQIFCLYNNPTLTDLIAIGTAIQWYDALTNGNLLNGTDALVDGQTYYASQTVGGCESATRLEVLVTITNPTSPTADNEQVFCQVETLHLSDLIASGNNIQWYDASIGGNLLPSNLVVVPGTIYYATQTINGCESQTRSDVTAYNSNLSLALNSTLEPKCNQANGSIQIDVTGGINPYTFNWSNGSSNQNLLNIEAGNYQITVTDSVGCSQTLSIILDCQKVDIPEIITPGDNGKNEAWILNLDANASVSIYNRWGSLVYSASPYKDDWNGKTNTGNSVGNDYLPSGTYFYVIDLKNGEKPLTGYIELVK